MGFISNYSTQELKKIKQKIQLQEKRKNPLNKKFGKLTVIQFLYSKNYKKYWKCKCDCGKETVISTDRLGRTLSCGCLKLNKTDFIDMTGWKMKQHGFPDSKITVISRGQNTSDGHVQWNCICQCSPEKIFLVDGRSLRRTKNPILNCKYCSPSSRGEEKISKILKENSLSYIREYKFFDCKDIRPLPFDFYINNKYLIEYDGEQHFKKEGQLFFDKDVSLIKKHDIIKNNYCRQNNIPLIRIPYTHFQKITVQDLLLETSQFII